jgi:hypothetical protein
MTPPVKVTAEQVLLVLAGLAGAACERSTQALPEPAASAKGPLPTTQVAPPEQPSPSAAASAVEAREVAPAAASAAPAGSAARGKTGKGGKEKGCAPGGCAPGACA